MMKLFTGLVISLLLIAPVLSQQDACSNDGEVRFDPDFYVNSTVPRPIQVCTRDRWSYICARGYDLDIWTTTDANVFCQQLGYLGSSDQSNLVFVNDSSLSSSGINIYIRTVFCSGIEDRLIECPHDDYTIGIGHGSCRRNRTSPYYYASANCSEANVTCRAGDIEQSNGSLRICSEGQWQSLCAIGWTDESAQVACRQLELNPYGAKATRTTDSVYLAANMTFHCTGVESRLSECTPTLVRSGVCSNLAGVICGVTPEPPVDVSIVAADLPVQISWSTVANAIGYTVNCTDDSVTSIVQESISINYTIIPYLLANTTYRCCVISLILNGLKSNPTCANITTPPLLPEEESTCIVVQPSESSIPSCSFPAESRIICESINSQLTSSTNVFSSSTDGSSSVTSSTNVFSSSTDGSSSVTSSTTLLSSSTISTPVNSNCPSSSVSISPVVSWIGGAVAGGTVVAVIMSVLILMCALVCHRANKRKQVYNLRKESDVIIANPDIQTSSPLKKDQILKDFKNPLYDVATTAAANEIPFDNPLYSEAQEINDNTYSTVN